MKHLRYWLAAAIVIILDQISKWAVLAEFEFAERRNIIPGFFDLTLVYNPGAAFSFLANHSGWQKYFFIVLAFAISIWLARSIVKEEFGRTGKQAAAFIIGGAMGNVIDRVVHGKVVDFILVYYQDWYYPAFNVADSFICIGAALLVFDGFKNGKKDQKAA